MKYRFSPMVILLALLFASLAAQDATAQRPGAPQQSDQQPVGEIRGAVVDAATGSPLQNAGVTVRREGSDAVVAGALTGADGAFRVEGLRPGSYTVRVSIIGYQAETEQAVVAAGGAPTDLGTVRLAAGEAIALEGITAEAERGAVTMQADRNVYTAENLPAAQSGNASDVLRGVPAVEVDADGNVTLRGNPNVVIQVNGRPLALRGDALANFLRQLPANLVERVEVVPNPSAKYDPSGMGGIVNVVLKENADLGTSGSFTVSAGTSGRYGGNASLGYGRGPLTLTASYGLNHDSRDSEGSNFRENRYLDPLTFLDQESDGDRTFTSHTLNAAADLRVSPRDVLSSHLLLTRRDGDSESLDDYLLLDASGTELEAFDRSSIGSGGGFVGDGSLGWKRTWKPQEHELATEMRYNGGSDDDSDDLVPGEGVTAGSPLATQIQRSESDTRTDTWTAQADYTRPFVADAKLETGFKGTLRGIGTGYTSELGFVGSGEPLQQTAFDFDYDERVAAGYALLSRGFGPLQAQAGLRVEQTWTDFALTTTGERFRDDYLSAFPSAALGWEIDDLRQLRASYSRRIERPDTRLLNPFPRTNDPLNRFVGNPELRPEFTDAYELALTQALPFGSLQVTPYYRRTTDVVRRFQETDTAGVSTTTFLNLATAKSYGSDFTASLRLGERISGFASASVYRAVTDGANVESGLESDATTWSTRINATAKLTPTLDLQYFQFYRAPRETEQGRVSSFSIADVSLRQKLLGDRVSVTLRVSDPFDTGGFTFRTDTPRLAQEVTRSFGSRALHLSFNYAFGQQPKLRNQRGRGNEPQAQEPELDVP